ncbi:18126_t:CDS:2, partial [Racocetra fulgida]
SDPSKFQLPKYATTNFANSPFKKPTKVTLEIYEEASCDFIKSTLNGGIPDKADSKAINTIAITPNCDVKELDEKFLECLKWENIGIRS